MNRTEKEHHIKGLTARFEKAKTFLFAGYRGLKVLQMTTLRSKLRSEQSTMQVLKNRLAKRALQEKGLDQYSSLINGPTAVACSEGDPAALAKVFVNFAKDNELFELRGGRVDGKEISINDLKLLATLPSKPELFAKMLGSLKAPPSNFVGVLSAVPRKLVQVINAIKETKT
ncbi:MAG: 50S ribosomal protein L10 [Deltaproteobacteria bacterium RIFCSPLOWO2_02_FULL_44_10]|nr:MAG: 50S ribosomal protein L10 [Deltaproteobacteria bacterium RIFCSPHIGHO2_02_FULL_44_16]OGQ45114.1 MAG: 50S ribosomal protein L10 [Deltaproteobacteria bacterium RIFCSPLOWO2_02_FULL_44_10]